MKTEYIGATKLQASILINPSQLDSSCDGYLIQVSTNLPPTLKASYRLLEEAQDIATRLNTGLN